MKSSRHTHQLTAVGRAAVALMLAAVVAAALVSAACGSTTSASATSPSPEGDVVAPSPSGTSAPGDGPDLAFVKGAISGPSSGNAVSSDGIYVANTDGTGLKELTSPGARPVWSPDGRQIAYISGHGLYLMEVDGSDQRQIVAGVDLRSGLAWSPDGRQIVYCESEGKNMSTLVRVNLDGSGRTEIAAAGHGDPAWAPDGRIFFMRESQICSVEPDGSGLSVVTAVSSQRASFSLSPDGKWLAISDLDRLVKMRASGQGRDVVLVNGMSRFAPPKAWFGIASSWSPDGTKIAFAGDQEAFLAPGGLYIINADGSGLRRVPNVGMGFNVVWRPR